MTNRPDYFGRYKNLHMERTPSGVLSLRFHTGRVVSVPRYGHGAAENRVRGMKK
jgi:hypothetical protein